MNKEKVSTRQGNTNIFFNNLIIVNFANINMSQKKEMCKNVNDKPTYSFRNCVIGF